MNRVSVAPVLAAIPAVLATACGPSVQLTYEGNVRFEHCYRLDLDPAIAPPHREACWTEWLGTYTYGQTNDRVEYARRRLAELKSSRESVPLRVDTMIETDAPAAPADAPAPTTVHSPPPPTAGATRALIEKPPPPSDEPPGHECAEHCSRVWYSCQASCSTGKQLPLCENCATDYRACVRDCFK